MALRLFRLAWITIFALAAINLLAGIGLESWTYGLDALISAVLGYFAMRRSLVALVLALGSYSLGFLAGDFAPGVLVLRFVVLAILISGVFALRQLKQPPPAEAGAL